MKNYLISFGVIFVVVVLVLFVIFTNLGMIVERSIETYGSRILGTEVTVDKVALFPRAGKASITGLTIANPSGYSEVNAFELTEITAKVDFQTETIKEILIKQPVINIEVVGGDSNIQVIADHTKAYQAGGGKQSPGQDDKDPVILNIELIRIESAQATMATDFSDKTYKFRIDELELHQLRGTREEVASQISRQFLQHVAHQASIEILKEKARTKAGKLGEKLQDLING